MARQLKYGTLRDRAEIINWALLDGPMPKDALCREVGKRLGVRVPDRYIDSAINFHRNWLSTEERALVTYYAGTTAVYELTEDSVKIREWIRWRSRDNETRLRTMLSQAEVACAVTDGRSAEGKRARAERKFIKRVLEDIEELAEDAA